LSVCTDGRLGATTITKACHAMCSFLQFVYADAQKSTAHDGISIGATPLGQAVVDKLNQFAVAARSLLHQEDSAPAISTPAIANYTGADSSQR
jgi:hypothetical protein